MGDAGATTTTGKPREIHILVSGAGPWREHIRNPANLIASALPFQLALDESSNVNIKIHITPTPWKVAYTWIEEHIPSFLFPTKAETDTGASSNKARPNFDIVLFIGMAAPRPYYSLETQAHRDGYLGADVDFKLPENKDFWANSGAPASLSTTFEIDTLHQQWQDNVPDELDVRISNDAGRFLCDYIYYTGLFEYWKQADKDLKSKRPCLFLHVPGAHDEESIARGVTATEGLIRALARCSVEGKDNAGGNAI